MKKLSVLGMLLCIALLVVPTVAQDTEDIPTATITASADTLSAPETLPEGLVTVTFENDAEAPFISIFARLNEGVTTDDFMAAMAENPMGMLPLVTLKGSPAVMPGQTASMTYTLEPGDYILVNFAAAPPQMASFSVEDEDDVEREMPVADVEVTMVDFGYGLPLTVPAGEHLWQIENAGEQWHELAIAPVEPDTTIEDVRDMLAEGEESGLKQQLLMVPMSSGETAWLTVDLEPGSYAIICNLPDVINAEEMHAHHELGMVQLITVEDALS